MLRFLFKCCKFLIKILYQYSLLTVFVVGFATCSIISTASIGQLDLRLTTPSSTYYLTYSKSSGLVLFILLVICYLVTIYKVIKSLKKKKKEGTKN